MTQTTAPGVQVSPGLLITIDGPAGAGKTTVSRRLARQLGYRYVDTGALYRAVALYAMQQEVAPDDDDGLTAMCRHLKLAFAPGKNDSRLMVNGRDVSDRIRTPEVAMMASAVSARAVVRRFLLAVQREIGRAKHAVFEGRDMGTVVFPDADAKFFLDASDTVRAQRRFEEYGPQSGQSLARVKEDMRRRDENDSRRKLSPLKPANDAIRIDCTHLSVDQVVDAMIGHIEKIRG